jgi:hypothetical protein
MSTWCDGYRIYGIATLDQNGLMRGLRRSDVYATLFHRKTRLYAVKSSFQNDFSIMIFNSDDVMFQLYWKQLWSKNQRRVKL